MAKRKKYVKAKEMRKIDDQTKPVDGDAVDQAVANTNSQKKKKKQKMAHKVDEKVEAKATGWKEWYAGVIVGVDDIEGLYTITFDDGETNNTIKEYQIRRILTEKYQVGDMVDVKMKGWKQLYRGEVVLVNSNRTYNIKFEDGDLKRGVKTIEIRGLAADRNIVTCSEQTMELLNAWSKDEGKVGKFISAVIDMVGDEDYLPKYVFQKSLREDAEFECSDAQIEEICARFADAKGDNVNCVDFVEYVQTEGQGLPSL